MKRLVIPVVIAAVLLLGVLASALGDGGGREDAGSGSPAPKRPNAILIVLDEFPGDTLLGPNGKVDAGRFPNFAKLAARSTWFRNAYASYDSTTKAVPLILDGIRPRKGTAPDARDHPRSLFTALHRAGYRTVSAEDATALCPPSMCRGASTRRPAIIPKLKKGRRERFDAFLRSIRPSARPTFWMKHMLLPHGPYLYLPSGAQSRPSSADPIRGMNTVPGFYDEYLTRHNEQRYLQQLGYVDHLLGRLLAKLERTGMADHTMVVVTADHGYAWQVGVPTRRSVNPSNVQELMPVPLFVNAPGQRRGRVRDAYAQTLDVAPTMADVLGVPLGYRTDGRSAFSRAVARRRGVAVVTRDFSQVVRISGPRWKARRRAVVERRLRELGSGGWASLFTGIGPNRKLIGRELTSLRRSSAAGARASLTGDYGEVARASGVVPSEIVGAVRGAEPDTTRALAVAVNGRIEAVGKSFHLTGDPTERFAVNVPEGSMRDGPNIVEVFEVTSGGALRLLARS